MKWVLIIIGGIIGVLVLLGGIGYYFLSKPIDPNSEMGQEYAKAFKASIAESCVSQINASGADATMQQQVQTACECSAEGTYQEIKDLPMTEQIARLQEADMQQKVGEIMQTCMQNAGLQ